MAENEYLDVFRDARWRTFANLLRRGPSLRSERVIREFERCLIQSFRSVGKRLPIQSLVQAQVSEDWRTVHLIIQDHRRQRHRCEPYAQLVIEVCRPGMSYAEAVDALVCGAVRRISDQLELNVVPSDNFPTIDDFCDERDSWVNELEPAIARITAQIVRDPKRLRVRPETGISKIEGLDRRLATSLLSWFPRGGN